MKNVQIKNVCNVNELRKIDSELKGGSNKRVRRFYRLTKYVDKKIGLK